MAVASQEVATAEGGRQAHTTSEDILPRNLERESAGCLRLLSAAVMNTDPKHLEEKWVYFRF